MKKLVVLLAFLPLIGFSQHLRPVCGYSIELKDCTVRKPGTWGDVWHLSGCVRIITNPNEKADFNIYVTKGHSDMVVFVAKDKNTFFGCGIWRWVSKNEDFSIRFVNNPDNAHFSVRFVDSQSDWYGCDICDE